MDVSGGPEATDGGPDWRRLEAIIAEFEAALWDGAHPDIAGLLPPPGPDRDALLPELVAAEMELLAERGEPTSPGEYLARFPELRRLRVDEWPQGAGASPRAGRPAAARLGPFALRQEVGRGAFGVVYRAEDERLGRVVALKLLHNGRLASPENVARFLREARGAARLGHPGVVPIFEAGVEDGVPYLVAEFVDGTNLAARLAADGPPRPDEAARLAALVGEALDHAHRLGVVHRDVKPSNILIGPDGRPRLADFGLARVEDEGTLTLQPQLLGTPAYMSPEQARGDSAAIGPRSDVYGLGAVLYELLAGVPPFRGAQRMVLAQVLDDEPHPPRRLNDAIPRDLETICLKAMAKEPGGRYATAAEFAADLRRFLDGAPVRARPVGPVAMLWGRCRRRPLVAGLAATLMLLAPATCLGVASFWLRAETYRRLAEENLDSAERGRRQAMRDLEVACRAIQNQGQLVQALASGADLGPDERRILIGGAIASSREFISVSSRGEAAGLRIGASSVVRNLAHLAARTGTPEEGVAAFVEAVEASDALMRAHPDEPDHRVGLAFMLAGLAECQLNAGRIEEAAESATRLERLDLIGRGEAVRSATESPEGFLRRVQAAQVAAAIGSLRDRLGQPRQSIAALKAARGLLEPPPQAGRPAAADDPARVAAATLLAKIQAELSRLSRTEGDPSRALGDAAVGVAAWQQAMAAGPEAEGPRRGLIQAELLRSDLLRRAGRPAEAREAALRAYSLGREIAEARTHADAGLIAELASCSAAVGSACYDLDLCAEALEAHRRCAALIESLPPGSVQSIEYRPTLAAARHNIGRDLHALGRYEEALSAFRESEAIHGSITAASPNNPDARSNLGGTRYRMALSLAALGRRDEAREAFEAAIADQTTALAFAPGTHRFADLLADHRSALADLRDP